MPSNTVGVAPSLVSFKNTIRRKAVPLETAIETLISLLKRRQIRGSRPCAEATAILLRRVVETFKVGDVSKLIESVRSVGQRLVTAQPQALAIGNVVRRILGLIREEAEEDREGENSAQSDTGSDIQNQHQRLLVARHLRNDASGAMSRDDIDGANSLATMSSITAGISMFSLLSHPHSNGASPAATTGSQSPTTHQPLSQQALSNLDAAKDLRAEVVEGILEIIEELKQADEQIAGYALEHIHSNEIILTHTSSDTVRKFLLKAATKRKFTVVHAETYPNEHEATHAMVTGLKAKIGDETGPLHFQKSLAAAGITVILIPDSAVFAMMSRVNKVILDTHVVLANGGLVTVAGAKGIAKVASMHRTPVVVLSGVYKLSPVYPFDINAFLEDGDPSKVTVYQNGDFVDKVEVENPLFDYVPADLVDLYITNLGGHAPSYLYRIIADHYRSEDIELSSSKSL